MLSINRTYFGLFVFTLLIMFPSIQLVKFLDELCVLMLCALIGADMLINRDFKKYRPLMVVVAVMTFYMVFTLFFRHFNTTKAVVVDYVSQLKPFIPFFVAYALKPKFTPKMNWLLKKICIFLAVLVPIIYFTGLTKPLILHVMYLGAMTFALGMIYLFTSIRDDGSVSRHDLAVVMAILACGLVCTRAKYYGEFVMAIYMLFMYRPGFLKRLNFTQLAVMVLALVMALLVSWNKIQYYFLQDVTIDVDRENMIAFARPAMYLGMFMVLCDYPLLGSGLASFATNASTTAVNYSTLYIDYKLNLVYGLSEQFYYFICDAFYPELAQFGLIGIALFLGFWVWVYGRLSKTLKGNSKYYFIIGVLIIVYMAIESVAGTIIVQGFGVMEMSLLGMAAAKAKDVIDENKKLN